MAGDHKSPLHSVQSANPLLPDHSMSPDICVPTPGIALTNANTAAINSHEDLSLVNSDLLSRHINKCHASEKPPTTTAPSRRKGTTAASRATTSKQACDQCVTSSLPCDGANPCSKCVQRKCRCTYVKFHRQTAPAGPGHPVPTIPVAGGRHAISLGAPRLPDDFLLAPPPGTMPMGSMYAAPHQYSMANSSAVYPHDFTSLPPLASALAPSDSSIPGMLQAHREAMESPDAMARMRAQAELLGRAGVMPNGTLTLAHPAPIADSSAALPGLYAAAASAQGNHYDNRYDLPQTTQWDGPRQYIQTKDFEAPYGPRSQSHPTVSSYSAAGAAGGEPSLQTHPPTTATSSSYDGAAPAYHNSGLPPAAQLHQPQHHHSRSDDLSSEGDFNSDAGSSGTGPSHSIPSSANSSAVHLPLPGFNNLRTRADGGGRDGFQAPNPNAPEGEGGFSSAFGLMSLDDPNVLAGIASDGQPFFSGLSFTGGKSGGNNTSGLSLATPTQHDLLAQLKSAGGREGMDNKEMQDFWKMYLRTPLTGPNSSGNHGMMFPLQTPTGPGLQLGQNVGQGSGRPSQSRRHSRVASLPSMKTPPLFAEERLGGNGYGPRPSTGDYDSHANQQGQSQQGGPQGGYNSTVRTTLYDGDDLKSYERAVLARKAPMTLNLVPKRKGSIAHPGATSSDGPNSTMGKSKSMSPVVPHAGFPSGLQGSTGGSKIADILNRPQSSSSTGTNESGGSGMSVPASNASIASQASSSLAYAFGGEGSADGQSQSQSSYQPAPPQPNDYAAATYRPSFKRIASQTLGPANTKRALLGPAGWDHEEEDDGEEPVHEEEEEEEEGYEQDPADAGGR
ncbi:hypothetical protein BD309DRAFT_984396 [Dichomitus squalens]|nr:hypothetical protein BD309DRAFT_984396 [Dichomitus squalens]